ncbi:MAG: adenosylcobinamide-GDP ribazoletransferase [Acidimicrobiaceae bacterium]|nr:adenosylcobinamide-GDP ribazoletransferase [Acidimicrobiaceae bacterium]MDE0515771.1 adenosylcobinamide-GDP ribazoletransferase [Acidimicrobiaceae bacterium]MDE0656693.1 adenosylcobinamide-GDP ribazoletransferase [Acidimicrobiaceae bacterium]MXZ97132.1 adenosylcobinamide-GDP ribazoletransferase [Acidimicrobiaceae bacterium]MYF44030.1 adenosylcobinamide-GDP ribazoletransferase [Acidimicrobiaceae bacterium]
MSLRGAWAFLTRLPGGAHPETDRDLGRSVPWFPVVGAVVGALSGAVYWALHGPLGASLAAVLAVAAGAVATGCFHEDGLADTADALGGTTRQRRLAIMKDPRVGAFGVLALVLSTLVRVFAVSSLAATDGLIALVVAHLLGRTMAVAVMGAAPAAAGTGLGHSYTAHRPRAWTVAAIVITSAAAASLGPPGAVSLATAASGAVLVGLIAWRAFGGVTGDVLGATEQVAEMAVLVSAAALVRTHGWSWT